MDATDFEVGLNPSPIFHVLETTCPDSQNGNEDDQELECLPDPSCDTNCRWKAKANGGECPKENTEKYDPHKYLSLHYEFGSS